MQYAVAAAFAVMIVCYLAFQRIKTIPGHSKALSITAKCAATAMAVVAALIGCIKNPQPAYWIILAGLVVCTIADGVLCVRFITGDLWIRACFIYCGILRDASSDVGEFDTVCCITGSGYSVLFTVPQTYRTQTPSCSGICYVALPDGQHGITAEATVLCGCPALCSFRCPARISGC